MEGGKERGEREQMGRREDVRKIERREESSSDMERGWKGRRERLVREKEGNKGEENDIVIGRESRGRGKQINTPPSSMPSSPSPPPLQHHHRFSTTLPPSPYHHLATTTTSLPTAPLQHNSFKTTQPLPSTHHITTTINTPTRPSPPPQQHRFSTTRLPPNTHCATTINLSTPLCNTSTNNHTTITNLPILLPQPVTTATSHHHTTTSGSSNDLLIKPKKNVVIRPSSVEVRLSDLDLQPRWLSNDLSDLSSLSTLGEYDLNDLSSHSAQESSVFEGIVAARQLHTITPLSTTDSSHSIQSLRPGTAVMESTRVPNSAEAKDSSDSGLVKLAVSDLSLEELRHIVDILE